MTTKANRKHQMEAKKHASQDVAAEEPKIDHREPAITKWEMAIYSAVSIVVIIGLIWFVVIRG